MGVEVPVISICIPWRSDHGWRETLFEWVLPAWHDTGFEICVGVDDDGGPINVSRALNRARAQATGDVLVVAAADHIPVPEAALSASRIAAVHGWSPVFAATAGITRDATEKVIAGEPVNIAASITGQVPFCTALLAVRRDVWDAVGGWDERFHGWGCEDTAFRLTLETLYPDPPWPEPLRTIALWHEAADKGRFDANAALLGEYIACEGNPDALRSMLLRRSG